MEFDKNRVYTAVNADELKPGDKVIVADDLDTLKRCVKDNSPIDTLRMVGDEDYLFRFGVKDNWVSFALAYLVERAENCTNCACHCEVTAHPELDRCKNWTSKTENRCSACARSKNGGRGTCVLEEGYGCDDYEQKVEKHCRPFKDTDELIKVFCEKTPKIYDKDDEKLFMPYIWVRYKNLPKSKGMLINGFEDNIVYVMYTDRSMQELFDKFEFLDGSPCGVEE